MREPVEPDKVSGLGLATGLFTLIPSRPVSTIDRDAGRRAIMWFPWLGLLIGLVGGVAAWAVTMRGGPLLGALIGLGLIELITGFMHLDGIADTADGLGASAKPANDAMEIMKKPDVGAMGVAAIVFVLALQVAGAASVVNPLAVGIVVALSPMIGRTTTVLATGTWVPNARPGGFGALFSGTITPVAALVTVVIALAITGGAGWWLAGVRGATSLVGGMLVALLGAHSWQRALVKKFGGLMGDMMGALIEAGVAIFAVSAAIAL